MWRAKGLGLEDLTPANRICTYCCCWRSTWREFGGTSRMLAGDDPSAGLFEAYVLFIVMDPGGDMKRFCVVLGSSSFY